MIATEKSLYPVSRACLLGTCYYPEHWPQSMWEQDAQRMRQLGITWVRIGEFAWSRIQPNANTWDWQWLDDAIDVLGQHGLQVILGTPSATPPRWVLDKFPDMLAYDQCNQPRKFGSRRHYCFSHLGYRQEAARIAGAMSERYSDNPYVMAWQVDNEYGCHDTTYSYSPSARAAFQQWLQAKYGVIEALNRSWGNVFWSMEYGVFEDIDLPSLTVTETNPIHGLDFRRFSSDQVAAFNRCQVDAIRRHGNLPISHNFMGRVTDFDHFQVSEDLDFVTWDSYPMGFLEDRVGASPKDQVRYARQGDCDFQAFHHDLYRSMGKGKRWWVMEQQPGPVNWAPSNPAPAPGMVRLWTWEAFAHGAEVVAYFRWRQVPFAQEQMHAGLLRPDNEPASAWHEVAQISQELADQEVSVVTASVALIFDYDAEFAWAVQPHAANTMYFDLVFDTYKALRKIGLTVDVISVNGCVEAHQRSPYGLILVPGAMTLSDCQKGVLDALQAPIVYGPRTGAKTKDFQIPSQLPPGIAALDLRVTHCESIREDAPIPLPEGGAIVRYREHVQSSIDPMASSPDQLGYLYQHGNIYYVAAWLDQTALVRVLAAICNSAKVNTLALPEGVRCVHTRSHVFWCNYSDLSHNVNGLVIPAFGIVWQPLP